MRLLKSTVLLMTLLCSVLYFQSCKSDCDDVQCENGGVCVDGLCECPNGYIGTSCENLNPARVQFLLDNGKTPLELFNGGISLEMLYGKMYKGGLIFYLDTINGGGLAAASMDQGSNTTWGCIDINIEGISDVNACAQNCLQPEPKDTLEGARIGDGMQNTNAILAECTSLQIAARLCRNIGAEWFLPSRSELNLVYLNLYLNGHGNFSFSGVNSGWYWSSTERGNSAWFQGFATGSQNAATKNFDLYVRAVRAF